MSDVPNTLREVVERGLLASPEPRRYRPPADPELKEAVKLLRQFSRNRPAWIHHEGSTWASERLLPGPELRDRLDAFLEKHGGRP